MKYGCPGPPEGTFLATVPFMGGTVGPVELYLRLVLAHQVLPECSHWCRVLLVQWGEICFGRWDLC
jgi:hypothetical protein